MKLSIIILCLLAERFWHIGDHLKRFKWFSSYYHMSLNAAPNVVITSPYMLTAWMLLPIMLVTWLLASTLHGSFMGIMDYLFGFILFLYCLGPKEFFADYEQISVDEATFAQVLPEHMASSLKRPSYETEQARFAHHILMDFVERILGVVFYYLFFGLWGALLYRLIHLIAHEQDKKKSEMFNFAYHIKCYLDWLPIRLVCLLFTLFGRMKHCGLYWLKSVISKPSYNDKFLLDMVFCVNRWSDANEKLPKTIEMTHQLIELCERLLVVVLLVLAAVTLGGWVH